MSTLSAEDVGDLITIYNSRPCPTSQAIPRDRRIMLPLPAVPAPPPPPPRDRRINRDPTDFIFFDRGHIRIYPAALLRGAVFRRGDPIGRVQIGGKYVEVESVGGENLPRGFVRIPLRIPLKYFVSQTKMSCLKIEDAVVEYRRKYNAWFLQNDPKQPKPQKPMLSNLKLSLGSEFENFLVPLETFYLSRLKNSFDYLLDLCEQRENDGIASYNVFSEMNDLYAPNRPDPNNRGHDAQARARWDSSANQFIYVRVSNVERVVFDEAALDSDPTNDPLLPFPNNRPNAPKPVRPPDDPTPSPVQIDEETLGKNITQGKPFKRDFLIMLPWEIPFCVLNPFVSDQYRKAWDLAQSQFEERYYTFWADIEQRRTDHLRKWKDYKLYNEQQRDYMYTNELPTAPYTERPEVKDFNLEWREFIFGLREQMKKVIFEPVRARGRKRRRGRRGSRMPRTPSPPRNGRGRALGRKRLRPDSPTDAAGAAVRAAGAAVRAAGDAVGAAVGAASDAVGAAVGAAVDAVAAARAAGGLGGAAGAGGGTGGLGGALGAGGGEQGESKVETRPRESKNNEDSLQSTRRNIDFGTTRRAAEIYRQANELRYNADPSSSEEESEVDDYELWEYKTHESDLISRIDRRTREIFEREEARKAVGNRSGMKDKIELRPSILLI